MAALYEAYTLCGLIPAQNSTDSGIHGIEPDGDEDRVIVTDCARSVTVYKVINTARKQYGSVGEEGRDPARAALSLGV